MSTLHSPPPLLFDKWESARCNRNWKASCGHHSIAAVCGVSLEDVRCVLTHTKGWMSPTNVGDALRALGADYSLRKGMKTKAVSQGINRVQFEGPWMHTGNPMDAYHHTHWVGVRDGFVLDTVIGPEWLPLRYWDLMVDEYVGDDGESGWHVTHWYQISNPIKP